MSSPRMGAGDPWVEQRRPPPEGGISGEPVLDRLAPGSRLWRIHATARSPLEFNTRAAGPFRGGRFDSPDGTPGVLYAADSLHGAVAEVLLREVPLVDEGARAVLKCQVLDRSVSVLEVTRELEVVALHGAAAAASVGQGLWLTKSDSVDYPLTRQWGSAIRTVAPRAAGFVWRARHDEDRLSYVLYENLAEGALAVRKSVPIDGGAGLEAVRAVLVEYRAVIEG